MMINLASAKLVNEVIIPTNKFSITNDQARQCLPVFLTKMQKLEI